MYFYLFIYLFLLMMDSDSSDAGTDLDVAYQHYMRSIISVLSVHTNKKFIIWPRRELSYPAQTVHVCTVHVYKWHKTVRRESSTSQNKVNEPN